MKRVFAPLVLLMAVGSLDCAHQQETKTEAAPAPVAKAEPPPEAAPAKDTCNADADCNANQLCIRNKCVDISTGLAECSALRVHFDFDKVDLKDDDRPGLTRISRCLRADQALRVTIEGNADERGTEEYNIALGQRRATVVEQYLENLGVSQAQLKTISYGYERPVCTAHNESCWAKNRRAAVKPSNQ